MKAAAAALALMVSLTASEAQAQRLFSAYEDHCVKRRAAPAAVLASADAAGWMPIPKAMLNQVAASARFQDVQGRLRSSDRSLELLLVGRMDQKVGRRQLHMQFCGVGSLPPDPQLKADLAAWAGVRPLNKDDSLIYAFVEEGGVRRPIDPDSADGFKLLRDGRVVVAGHQENAQTSMALFALPTTSENP